MTTTRVSEGGLGGRGPILGSGTAILEGSGVTYIDDGDLRSHGDCLLMSSCFYVLKMGQFGWNWNWN